LQARIFSLHVPPSAKIIYFIYLVKASGNSSNIVPDSQQNR
jgi:hypothetical protein